MYILDHIAFQKLSSGRRLKVPPAKKNLFKKSAILILNAKFYCTVYFFYVHVLNDVILFIYQFQYILLIN